MMTLDDVMLHGADDMVEEIDFKIFNAINSYNLMSLAPTHRKPAGEAVHAIFKNLKIEKYLDYFEERNTIVGLPYHNSYHTYCMVLNCYEGGYHERISESEQRVLAIAALFHDFNHFGGHQPDDVNVAEAVRCLHQALLVCDQLSNEEEVAAVNTVKITKYPYESDPLTITEKIIRDADLMQPYEERTETLLLQYLGLKTEIEISHKRVYTAVDFAEGNFQFLNKTAWNTRWAIAKAQWCDWEAKKVALKNLLSGVR